MCCSLSSYFTLFILDYMLLILVMDKVMRCFLVVVLVVLTVNADSSCENICTFLYNNPDWESHTSIADTKFRQSVTAGSVTGIVTASFETFASYYDGKTHDFLRFVKGKVIDDGLNENNQPLFLKILLNSNGVVVGKRGGTNYGEKTLSYKISDNIQISDMNSDFYDIFFGAPGEAHNYGFNFGIPSTWEAFQNNNVRLKDVKTIKSDGRCTVYKYISACTDPTPRLCDDEQHVSVNVNPGSSFILSCSGSGAPFLDVTWTKDGNPTEIVPTTVHTTTEPDHKIQSTIKIDSITVDHLGNWICTIQNENFEVSVSKAYELKYTYPATLVKFPDIDYYHGSETDDTTFTWVVESWPLEQVSLNCGNISVLRDENTASVPPQLTFTLVLRMQDVLRCSLKDGENVLETREITRVGYNCEAGEGGVGKKCEVCENAQTSVAGIGNCFPANSSCTEGFWGIDEDCASCPANQTSFNRTVKPQECFPDVSYCEEGSYGYGTNCRLCPSGTTSSPETKKVTECYVPDKNLLIRTIGGGAGGLFVVLVSVAVSCFLIRRRKVRKSTLEMNSEINDALSNVDEENASPAYPSVSEHVEYATISRALPRHDASCDETYAVISRGDKSQEKKSKELLESKRDASPDSIGVPTKVPADLDDDDAYAKLGDVKRVYSFDHLDEESVYSKLDTPNSSKKTQVEFVKIESDHIDSNVDDGQPGIEVDEDPIYANEVER